MELDLYCTEPHPARIGEIARQAQAARIREYILALRAIFDAFAKRAPLRFEGEFHRFSLLTDFFDPGPIEVPDPPIYLAGVNERLGRVAGEVADGFCVHPLNSPKYLAEVLRPSIEEGAKNAGRDASAVSLVAPVFTIIGEPGSDLDRQRDAIRLQIAFYGTTPSYGRVFEVHGHPDMTAKLGGLLRAGDNEKLAAAIDDDLVDAFSVTASWDGLADALISRFAGMAERIFPYAVVGLDNPGVAERWQAVAEAVSAA